MSMNMLNSVGGSSYSAAYQPPTTTPQLDTAGGGSQQQQMLTIIQSLLTLLTVLTGQMGAGQKDAPGGIKNGPTSDAYTPSNGPYNLMAQPPAPSPTPAASNAGAPAPSPSGPTPSSLKDLDNKYGPIVDKAVAEANAKGAKLDRNYVLATIMHESSGDPNSKGDFNKDGRPTSLGVMQINDSHGLSEADRYNPEVAIPYAVKNIMAPLSAKYNGDVVKTAAAYMTGDQIDGPYADKAMSYGQDIKNMMDGK